MNREEIVGILDFIRGSERLKNTMRSGYTSTGRNESVAEHTWRLCLMAMVLEKYFPEADMTRVLKICIVHDLGEALNGDIPAPLQSEELSKASNERNDLLILVDSLPADIQHELIGLWDEYENASSPEARAAKALDKLETIIQHNQGKNPDNFDYFFNLDYGKTYTSEHPVASEIRKILDAETIKRSEEARKQYQLKNEEENN
jgi:putative hydrolases of HD superfamily